jgi:hypothetical protein
MFAFLQTGLNKTKLSFTNIVGYDDFLSVVESESDKFIKALEEKEFALLDNFYDMFTTENLATNLNKQRYKDYLSTIDYDNLDTIKESPTPTQRRKLIADIEATQPTQPSTQPIAPEETEGKSRLGLTETKRDQIFTYNDANSKNEFYYTNISINNPDIVFIFNTSKKEYDAQYKVKFNNQSYFGSKVPDMSIDFLTGMNNTNDGFSNLDPAKFGALKDLWERRIATVKSLIVGGVSVAFPETGFGNIASMPQELFVYLSKRLYEEFGYLNPGSTMYNDMMDIIGRTQGISDEEILQQFGLEEDPFKCR